MEDRIEFEEETITEEVFNGEIDINEKRSSKQERTHAFEIFKKATSQNINKSEYKIEWLDEDFESNTKHFRVLHTYKKKVPYRISYEEIYKGEYYLTGETISPEERRSQIFNLLREEGYSIENENDYEIVIPSSEEYDATQMINFIVYHVNKEKVDEEELEASKDNVSEDLKESYQEMIDLKKELESTTDTDKLEELSEKVEDALDSADMIIEKRLHDYGVFELKIIKYKDRLAEAEEEMRKKEEEYQQVFEETRNLMETKEDLTEEEYEALKRSKDKNNSKLQTISNEKDKLKSRISSIKSDLNKVKRDLEMAKMLGISADEYIEITKSVEKNDILERIIEKKGLKDELEDILSTPKRNRTKEQRRIIKEVKDEIITAIAKHKLENPKTSAIDSIQALYGIGNMIPTDGRERAILVKPEKYALIVRRADELPHKIVGKPEVNYTPSEAPKDLEGVFPTREIKDKITIFEDENNPGTFYARKPVFMRFTIPSDKNEEVRIDGTLCRKISSKYVDRIKENKDNDYSPYIVEEVKKAVKSEAKPSKELAEGLIDKITIFEDVNNPGKFYVRKPVFMRFTIPSDKKTESRIDGTLCREISADFVEKIIKNQDNDYSPYRVEEVKREVIPEFKEEMNSEVTDLVPAEYYDINKTIERLKKLSEEKIGNEELPTPVEDEKVASEDTSIPQEDIIKNDVHDEALLEENDGKVNSEETDTSTKEVTDLTIYDDRKLEDILKQYVGKEDPVVKVTEDTRIDGEPDEEDVIEEVGVEPTTEPKKEKKEKPVKKAPVSKKTEPKPTVIVSPPKKTEPKPAKTEPKPVHTEPKPVATEPKEKKTTPVAKHKPHVEEIIANLTKGLNIHAKDAKKFNASNVKVAKGFKQELSSGNYLYNVVHFVPAVIKFPISLIRKIYNAATLGTRARGAMQIFKTRLEKLSEEELEVLFENYKGSQLKTDMNNQINPLILDRLRKYGLAKVEKLNETIKKDYKILFVKLGKIKALEHELAGDIGSGEKDVLEANRKELTREAADVIKEIIECRKEADNLLSSGVHGIEEDFKAVSTKLNYVGLRFGKNNHFDNDLQEKLGNFGRNLNIAIENNNDEAIVQNFMGLESCYYKNTEIRGSIVGKRSVGTKYYTPLAEQFDYRDDPFIRDIFTTAAVAGATLSAINAFRTNQVIAEHNRQLAEHNRDVEEINRINDETMYYVNETGKQIAFRKGVFRDGMKANAEQDILTNAAVRERAHLDQTNWQFNDTYHQIDPAGHEAYNAFNQEISSRIDATAADYASGAIPFDEVLSRVAQISTDAHATLTSVVEDSLAILRQYAATHPQFDLTAFEQSMQFIVDNPYAIANMNQAMVDVVNMGESLSTLQAAHLEALSMLPVEMSTKIIGAASSAVLASTVASTLSKGPKKKTKYGDEVTAMMDEYMKEEEKKSGKAK